MTERSCIYPITDLWKVLAKGGCFAGKNMKRILLTIDVEDWFQVENFKRWIPYNSWDSQELRVEKNTHKLLELFDSIKVGANFSKLPKATFFILGWIAERLPHLVREIHDRGHEIASHGFSHALSYNQSKDVLKDDLNKSKSLLEDLIGSSVVGYRAPSFSIDDDVLRVIEESGFLYDSSYNSFSLHDRYGAPSICSRRNQEKHVVKISKYFYELPISNLQYGRYILPWGGGGYFRILPFSLFRIGVKYILERSNAYLFYCHPWEFDPGQPRVDDASFLFKFRHYMNLKTALNKLTGIINSFSACEFITCSQYLKNINH